MVNQLTPSAKVPAIIGIISVIYAVHIALFTEIRFLVTVQTGLSDQIQIGLDLATCTETFDEVFYWMSSLGVNPSVLPSLLARPCAQKTEVYYLISSLGTHPSPLSLLWARPSAVLACRQCYCAGSSLTLGLNLRALVRGIFWSSSPGVFLRVLRFPPHLHRLMAQPIK